MHVARIIALAVVVALASGCSATELSWWRVADSDEREAVMVHIITDAADEFGVDAATLIAIARCESGLRADAKSTRS